MGWAIYWVALVLAILWFSIAVQHEGKLPMWISFACLNIAIALAVGGLVYWEGTQ